MKSCFKVVVAVVTSVLCAAFAFLPLSAHGADGDALSYGLADEIPKLVSYDGYLSTQTRAIVMDLATGLYYT